MSDSKQVQVAGRFIIITCFITTPSFDRSDFNESFSLSLIEMLDQASGWGGGALWEGEQGGLRLHAHYGKWKVFHIFTPI